MEDSVKTLSLWEQINKTCPHCRQLTLDTTKSATSGIYIYHCENCGYHELF